MQFAARWMPLAIRFIAHTRAANHPTTFTMHQFQVKCWNYAASGFDWSTRTIPRKLHFKSNLISALIELSIEAVCAQVLSYAIPLHLLHNKSDRWLEPLPSGSFQVTTCATNALSLGLSLWSNNFKRSHEEFEQKGAPNRYASNGAKRTMKQEKRRSSARGAAAALTRYGGQGFKHGISMLNL